MLEKPKIQLKLNTLASGWLAVELSVNNYRCTFMASNIPQAKAVIFDCAAINTIDLSALGMLEALNIRLSELEPI